MYIPTVTYVHKYLHVGMYRISAAFIRYIYKHLRCAYYITVYNRRALQACQLQINLPPVCLYSINDIHLLSGAVGLFRYLNWLVWAISTTTKNLLSTLGICMNLHELSGFSYLVNWHVITCFIQP